MSDLPSQKGRWFDRAVFYHIYPLGMLGSGGDGLRRLPRLIDHLHTLGITAIYLGPVFQSTTHGYDTADYFHVDPRLGSDDDLTRFVDICHLNGIRVVVDGVFNHVGREFWGFKEALRDGPKSKAWHWFVGLSLDEHAPNGVRYDTWEEHENLVKLNLDNNDTRQHLFGAIDTWIQQFHIDGIRLDAADCLSLDFIRALRAFTDSKKDDFFLFGEIIHGDYRTWANDAMFHGTTNYEAYKGIWSSHNDKNAFEIAYSLNRQFGENGIYRHLSLYSFVENHDVNRLASTLKNDIDLFTCYALMFLMPGIPSIYYTGEWGKKGTKTSGYEADLPVRPNISPEDLSHGILCDAVGNARLYRFLCKLAQTRRHAPELMSGNYRQLSVSSEILCFTREQTICAISMKDESCEQTLDAPCARYVDVLNHNAMYESCNGKVTLTLMPHRAYALRPLI